MGATNSIVSPNSSFEHERQGTSSSVSEHYGEHGHEVKENTSVYYRKSILLKHFLIGNGFSEDTFCLICLEFFAKESYLQHSILTRHEEIKLKLDQVIYPYPCSCCHQRFSSLSALEHHRELHSLADYKGANAVDANSKFRSVCCYLCLLPFSDLISRKIHGKSTEHSVRLEMAMEVDLRNTFSSKKPGGNLVSDMNLCGNLSSMPSMPDIQKKLSNAPVVTVHKENYFENSCNTPGTDRFGVCDKEGKSTKPENHRMYYCSPCDVSVPKVNVSTHEMGHKHKSKCRLWIAGSWKTIEKQSANQDTSVAIDKSTSSVFNLKLPNEEPGCTNQLSNEPSKKVEAVSVTRSNFSGSLPSKLLSQNKVNHETQVPYLCKKYGTGRQCDTPADCGEVKSTKTENDSNYYCSPCAVTVPKANVTTHENGQKHKNRTKNHSVKDFCIGEAEMMTDESVRQMIEEYLLLKEPFVHLEVNSDEFYVCAKCNLRLQYDVMLTHVIGRRHLKSVETFDCTAYYHKLNFLLKLGALRTQKLKILKTIRPDTVTNFIKVASCLLKVTDADLMLSHTSSSIPQIASKKNVESSCTMPGLHISGPSVHDMNDDLGKLKKISSDTAIPSGVRSCHKSSSLPQCSSSSLLPSKLHHQSGNASVSTVPISNGTNDVSLTSHFEISKAHSQNSLSQLNNHNPQSVSDSEEDLTSLFETLVIGNKSGISLQEEFNLACPSGDISDYEIQCGICGVAFQIFNVDGEEDVDFSFDMHVQNDPQHILATEVPTERDPQSMAESAKTSSLSLKPSKTPRASKFSPMSKPVILNLKGKSKVIEELFSLEEKNITVSQKGNYFCKLCTASPTTKNQLGDHLLGSKHLSRKWLNNLTDIELSQWLEKLNFYLKSGIAHYPFLRAWNRINMLMSNCNRSCLKSISKSVPPSSTFNKSINSTVRVGVSTNATADSKLKLSPTLQFYYCPHCLQNISTKSKIARKKHRRICKDKIQTDLVIPSASGTHTESRKKKHSCNCFVCV